jgi:predicted deacylase
MELAASLTVTKQSNKYLIKVDSNIADGTFSLVATKKGAKSISFKVGTDDAGSYALRTTRNLKGFLLVLKYNGELLDKIQVN